MQNNQLDQDAVRLAQAIRQTESQNNPTVKGKSGEHGSYQFMPETWNQYSKKYGVNVPLEQATPVQQNEVAYKRIKELKDQGYNVGQIASIWNSGQPEWEGKVGVNKHGVQYNVPQYVDKVANTYQSLKSGQQPQQGSSGYVTQVAISKPTQSNQQQSSEPEEKGYVEDLGGKIGERAKYVAQGISDAVTGKINPLSGILHTAGGIAGGVNDIVGTTLEHTPIVGSVVKGIGNVIGKGVEGVLQTDIGKKGLETATKFAEEHPELSANLGDVGNIVGAAGTFTGIGAAKNLATKGIAGALGRNVLKDVVLDVAPELGENALAKSVAKQGLKKSLLTGKISSVADTATKEVADAVARSVPGFSKATTFADKVNLTRDAVYNMADNLKKAVIQSGDKAYDFKQLAQKLYNPDLPILLSKDGLDTAYDRVLAKTLDLVKKQGNKVSDLFEARKAFDQLIQREIPNIYTSETLTPMRTAIKDLRRGLNDFISENLPENVGFKQSLRTQSRLFDAIENMSPKAVKEIGSTRVSRFISRHPKTAGLIKKGAVAAGTGLATGLGIKGYDILNN